MGGHPRRLEARRQEGFLRRCLARGFGRRLTVFVHDVQVSYIAPRLPTLPPLTVIYTTHILIYTRYTRSPRSHITPSPPTQTLSISVPSQKKVLLVSGTPQLVVRRKRPALMLLGLRLRVVPTPPLTARTSAMTASHPHTMTSTWTTGHLTTFSGVTASVPVPGHIP